MSVKHVAFYIPDLSGGGAERMRLALIAQMLARNIDVSLIVSARVGALVSLLPDDLHVVELGKRRMLSAVLPLARFLRRTKPDILISSLDHNNVSAILASIVACVSTRVIICQHNALSAERALGWRYRLIPWLYWLLQRRASGIIAVSYGVADDLATTCGIKRSRITPIYNPIIGPDFATRLVGAVPHPWLEGPGRCSTFIFAGRLTPQKNPAMALEALAILVKHQPAKLIMMGEGAMLADLKDKVTALCLDDHVVFVGYQSNPLLWLKHACAVLLTSQYEGLGNVIVEALACGTPVISTDCPYGPAEILLGGAIGKLVPVGDAEALAAAMLAQTQTTTAVDKTILIDRAADFTAETCADEHEALFAKILSRRTVRVLGMHLSTLSACDILNGIVETAVTEGVRLVVTPNLDHVRLLRRPAFLAAYESAYLVCPDGFPILLYGRLRGLILKSRVTGCELFRLLSNDRRLERKRLFFVVESKQTSKAIYLWAARLALDVVVAVAPLEFLEFPEAQRVMASAISDAAPSILIVTLGAPTSEMFVHQHRAALPPCWALCIGQAVRVELGLVERAPAILQACGLEWLWRTYQEPRRLFGRYIRALLWFPIAILRDLKPVNPEVSNRL